MPLEQFQAFMLFELMQVPYHVEVSKFVARATPVQCHISKILSDAASFAQRAANSM